MATEAIAVESGDIVHGTLATTWILPSVFPSFGGTIDLTADSSGELKVKEIGPDWPLYPTSATPVHLHSWSTAELVRFEPAVDLHAAPMHGTVSRRVSLDYVGQRLSQMLVRSVFEQEPYPGRLVLVRSAMYARALLRAYVPTPSVVPSEEGGVTFVWHKGGWDVEIDVMPSECTVWARNRRTRESWSGDIADRWYDVTDLLARLGTEARA